MRLSVWLTPYFTSHDDWPLYRTRAVTGVQQLVDLVSMVEQRVHRVLVCLQEYQSMRVRITDSSESCGRSVEYGYSKQGPYDIYCSGEEKVTKEEPWAAPCNN